MAHSVDTLLAQIAQLPENERHTLMVELGRRYGLPEPTLLATSPMQRAADMQKDPVGPVADYRIVFDGGSRGNPGPGYGSYVLSASGGGPMPLVRLDLGERVTDNEAEYDTLIAALQDLLARIGAAGHKAEEFTLEVCGDSELLVSQVQGTWQTRDGKIRTRGNVVRQLLQQFRAHRLASWPLQQITQVLGN